MNAPTQPAGQNSPTLHRSAANPVDWRRHLPARWADKVVEALDFTRHVEYEMPAWRVLGHDADGALCFYAHDYLLTEGRSDNDEDFYTDVTAGEMVRGWRLSDDRWLIYRQLRGDDERIPTRPFYSLSDRPPRERHESLPPARPQISCNRTVLDPNGAQFCGPENINIDNPKDNDKFVIGVNHYGASQGGTTAKPHVNLYCNGARVLSIGYNPATGQTQFPILRTTGGDTNGDFWTAALIAAHVDGGQLVGCDVATIPSHVADPTRDGPSPDGGGNALCVDSRMNGSPAPNQYNYATHQFVDPGSKQGLTPGVQPMSPDQFCKH